MTTTDTDPTMNSIWPIALRCILAISISPALAFGQEDSELKYYPKVGYHDRLFRNVSVHDPSIIEVDGSWYVFGSHLAAAKTDDLVQWQSVADGVNEANPLFDNVVTELADLFAWSGTVGLWANDVIQLDDGRFYMYPNLSLLSEPRASLALAVADDIEGPYSDRGIFLQSGMWNQISEDGVNIYDPRIHPNTVDPDTFFDQDGDLWMVYGSYSGGIFILEMNPESGFPEPGQGYGKRLMGGNHSRIEGANILYSRHTGYYYLFVSFGGLSADGAYNIRVARSTRPDGPYLDALGNDMVDVKANPALPLFDDASIEPYAQKLMGNFLWQREVGEPGTGDGHGYVSPGHNTSMYDPATDKYFLVFHTRFPGRGEAHEVRVHELFFNRDGWPVAAPFRYVPPWHQPGVFNADSMLFPGGAIPSMRWSPCWEKRHCKRLETVAIDEIVGNYKLIDHGKAITTEIKHAQVMTLQESGDISGEFSGQWQAGNGNHITLEVDGLGTFDGVLSRGWNETAGRFNLTFSAQSDEGVSLWANQLENKRPADVLSDIYQDLDLGDTSNVSSDLDLPAQATRLATIDWTSSDPSVIAVDGTVNRPGTGTGDRMVTLTATIRFGGLSTSKVFNVTVKERPASSLLAHYAFENNFVDLTGRQDAGTPSGDRIDTAGGTFTFSAGIEGNAVAFDGASGIRMPNGLIQGNVYTVSVWLNPSALTTYTTTFFGARDNTHWVSLLPRGHEFVNYATMVWSGEDWYDAGTGMNIPLNQWSHVAFTVDAGEIRVYIDGEQRFSGSNFPDLFTTTNGIFTLGVNWWDPAYRGMMDELMIFEEALSAQEIAELATP